jgi:hypothetical protein
MGAWAVSFWFTSDCDFPTSWAAMFSGTSISGVDHSNLPCDLGFSFLLARTLEGTLQGWNIPQTPAHLILPLQKGFFRWLKRSQLSYIHLCLTKKPARISQKPASSQPLLCLPLLPQGGTPMSLFQPSQEEDELLSDKYTNGKDN